jgi:hypothetical protein
MFKRRDGIAVCALLLALLGSGCGGGQSGNSSGSSCNGGGGGGCAKPVATSLSPSSAVSDTGPITLTFNGSGFALGDSLTVSFCVSQLCQNPVSLPINSSQSSQTALVVTIPNSAIQSPGTYGLQVQDNTSGNATAALTFTVLSTTVTISPNPVTASAGGAPVTLTISVANDVPTNMMTGAVASGAMCGGPCGSLGPIQGTAGGGSYTVLYAPPTSIEQATTTQSITVSSNLAGSTSGETPLKLTSTSLLCPAAGNEALMTGQWVFLVQGFDGANPMATVATFTVDGSIGLITAGTVDINEAGSTPQTDLTVEPSGSTYSVDSRGQACVGLATSAGMKVFHAALSSYANGLATEGQIEEFDDILGTGPRALGSLKQQTAPSTGWNTSSLNNYFMLGLTGWDAALGRVSAAGSISLDGNGNINSVGMGGPGLVDEDDNGTLTTAQAIPAGTYSLDSTGRGGVTFTIGSTPVSGVIYAATADDLFFLSTTQVSASVPLVSGRVYARFATPLTNANYVTGYQLVEITGASDATIGILNLGSGSGQSGTVTGTLWQYSGGTASSQQVSGTFTITDQAHGRVTFSIAGWTNPPVAYLNGFSINASLGSQLLPTSGFLVGTGSNGDGGEIVWQSAVSTSFSAMSLKYSAAYSDSLIYPATCTPATNSDCQWTSAGQVTLDGTSSWVAVLDLSTDLAGATPLRPGFGAKGSYTINGDGSGTFGNWPIVTNGVRTYRIIEDSSPVIGIMTKQ